MKKLLILLILIGCAILSSCANSPKLRKPLSSITVPAKIVDYTSSVIVIRPLFIGDYTLVEDSIGVRYLLFGDWGSIGDEFRIHVALLRGL